jgi:hypothetical protein
MKKHPQLVRRWHQVKNLLPLLAVGMQLVSPVPMKHLPQETKVLDLPLANGIVATLAFLLLENFHQKSCQM